MSFAVRISTDACCQCVLGDISAPQIDINACAMRCLQPGEKAQQEERPQDGWGEGLEEGEGTGGLPSSEGTATAQIFK